MAHRARSPSQEVTPEGSDLKALCLRHCLRHLSCAIRRRVDLALLDSIAGSKYKQMKFKVARWQQTQRLGTISFESRFNTEARGLN